MTFTAATALTAAQLNAHLRDNLNETLAGKAETKGAFFVADSADAVSERTIQNKSIDFAESTASTSYVDLSTVGPTISAVTGTRALVYISTRMYNGSVNALCAMSYAVSGATTLAADDVRCVMIDGLATANRMHQGVFDVPTLTAGTNTFTCKYRAGGAGTAYFGWRRIGVWAL